MGKGTKGIRYHRVACEYCGREIARTMIGYHEASQCKAKPVILAERQAKEAADRLEWARTCSITDPKLTLGDLQRAGRLEEFKQACKNERSL